MIERSGFSPERSSLRGVGASLVVACHLLLWSEMLLPAATMGLVVVIQLSNVGWIGVALFLTLSIYLLMGSLDANADLKRYFLRRIKRIWPLYFATCMVIFILADRNWTTLALNLSFVAVFDPAWAFHLSGVWAPNYVIWTLQIEEFAYLFFPLIARLDHRYRVWLGWGLVGSLGIVVGAGVLGYPVSYFTPWGWLSCYGFGLLIYEGKSRSLGPWCLIPAILPMIVPGLGWPLGLICIGPGIAWLIAYPPKFLKTASLVAVGECSYALYLIHLLFLDCLGPVGIVISYPAAWIIESLQRGRQMLARVRSV